MASQSGASVLRRHPLDPDQLGLTMLGLVIGWLVPIGASLVIAVDDTLFRRHRRRRRYGTE